MQPPHNLQIICWEGDHEPLVVNSLLCASVMITFVCVWSVLCDTFGTEPDFYDAGTSVRVYSLLELKESGKP